MDVITDKDWTTDVQQEDGYTLTRNYQKIGFSKAPYIESPLIENEVIAPNSENIYVINYEFKETYQDQNADQGKLFRTNLEIVVK